MSAQFGRWNLRSSAGGLKPAHGCSPLAPFGPDGHFTYRKDNVEIHYHAFHTTPEALGETQPLVLGSGAVFTWNGRLDNRAECLAAAGEQLPESSADVAVAAACYIRLVTDCFRRFVGDWALSIWNPQEESLLLARDPMGIQPLFYYADARQILWSSILDPLVTRTAELELEPEYLAGWLGTFPAAHLTPFRGIYSVPPSSFVRFAKGRITSARFWDFDPDKVIRYRNDTEYEEHFRHVFSESVRRRLRSSAPVLAELSGGMDSSSIVAVADVLMGDGNRETSRLDTVSYYDEFEPNWNERPYFERVEQKRGRAGCHIDLGSQVFFMSALRKKRFRAIPSESGIVTEAQQRFRELLHAKGHRVVLSGLGGDEVTGGVPSPGSELRDLIASGHLVAFAGRLKQWALTERRPWVLLLWETLRDFLPIPIEGGSKRNSPPSWIQPILLRTYRQAFLGYPRRIRFFSTRPGFEEAMITVDALRRHIAVLAPPRNPLYERRFPFFDRDLMEFLFAIPREQLVRPGQRRSLMRRALRGIVPSEVLDRKRKAFRAHSSLAAFSAEREALNDLTQRMLLASLGVVCEKRLRGALEECRRGRDPSVPLLRALALEIWLRDADVLREQTPSAELLDRNLVREPL